ncbi:MAG TPA: glycosyltransferase [Chthoniobacteraceae bacterium]|nr:glycosyltransferase [Chthoniobacteraceae bacterium]
MAPPSEAAVSIIIPCYNAARYVGETIESALAQTHPACEVIVIDDGSTDESLSVIQRYGGRVRWESGPNRGVCAARNRGLELATGEWIQFLDADDLISPRKIELQLAALEGKGPGVMATCPVRFFDGRGFQGPPHWVDHWRGEIDGLEMVVEMWFYDVWLNPHCWLTPRALIRERGGWLESLTHGEDVEFFGRTAAGARRVVVVAGDEALAWYRQRDCGGNATTNDSYRSRKSSFDAWDAVQKIILAQRGDRKARQAVLRYLQTVALVARRHPALVTEIARREKELGVWDFNFRESFKRGLLFGLLGIEKTLKLRRWFGRH